MKYSQKSHSGDRNHNMTVVLFTLLCVLICGSLALSPKAQTKTSDEQDVTPKTVPGRNGKIAFSSNRDGNGNMTSTRWRRTAVTCSDSPITRHTIYLRSGRPTARRSLSPAVETIPVSDAHPAAVVSMKFT